MEMKMLLREILREGAVADKYAELETTASEYSPYMYIEAREATVDEIGVALTSIIPGPKTAGEKFVKKGNYVARILQSGSTKIDNPMSKLYVLNQKSFDLFSKLPNRKPDVEGYVEYETSGDVFQVVQDGSQYIIKNGKQITQIPASLFDKQFRKKQK